MPVDNDASEHNTAYVEPCTAFIQAFATGMDELGIHCPECRWKGGFVATITSHYLSVLQGRHDKHARHEAKKRERERVREALAALKAAHDGRAAK